MLYILGFTIVYGLGFLAGRMDCSMRRLEQPMLTAQDLEVMLQRRAPV